jgi:thiamine-phosphate pyrophosphorylase
MALPANDRHPRLGAARLYFVCEARPRGSDPEPLLEATLEGGTGMLELREKSPEDDSWLIAHSRPFREASERHRVPFILNDRPDLVGDCGADGVHVGQKDTPVAEARARLGDEHLIGLSTHSAAQLDAACSAPPRARPDYISVGPVWETPTKEGRAAAGLELIEHAAREATLPWFAIGGINLSNVGDVVAAGAERIVVVRALRDAGDPEPVARRLREAIEAGAEVWNG